MAETKLTKKEIDDLRRASWRSGASSQTQLATIEEDTFAATQSEMSGDVGLDDESADAGTATFEREKDLSIEQNVRDLLRQDRAGAQAHRRRHLRPLRAVRQAHREGPHQGAALRRPLHQGRPGAVAPLAPWTASAVAARPSCSPPPASPTCWTASRSSGPSDTLAGPPRRRDPGRAHAALHDELGRRVQPRRQRALAVRRRPRSSCRCSSSPPRSVTEHAARRSRSVWSWAARSATSPTGSCAGPGSAAASSTSSTSTSGPSSTSPTARSWSARSCSLASMRCDARPDEVEPRPPMTA